MDQKKQGRSEEEKWVLDASVDYKGRLPFRASTGGWKASLFVLIIEFNERISYFALFANLITYLTKVIHQDLSTAAKSVNYWAGTTTLMPLIGGFIADAYTGRFHMVIFSSLVYLIGLSLLTMSQFIPSLKPSNNNQPRVVHEAAFFLAVYCISLGIGGHKPSLESFGADQFDDEHREERKKKMSFFNWWSFIVCFALLLGATMVVYVQDFVSWGVASLILTILMALSTIAFYAGRPFYRYKQPQGNPFRPILQVLFSAIRKRNLSCPSDPALLYEVPASDKSQGRLLSHTSRLRFLDKAAIIEEKYVEQKDNTWRLATVTRVEETKLVLNVFPIWLTSLTAGLCMAQASTLFVKQATVMNLNISNNFKLPPASLISITALGTLISLPIYDRIIVPTLRKVTGNERGISILRRIGIGLTLSVILMVVAALVEAKRLLRSDEGTIMSVSWLIPQYLILGIGNSFSLVGMQEYFYDQVPDSMRSLGVAFYLGSNGVGNFLSSFLIMIVDNVTGKSGKSWIGKDINSSRLDRYYWMLAMINALDFEEEKWVHDASVDYKGRVAHRASTGVWKASLFVLAIEFSERLSHFGISSNLIMYLANVMHEDLKTATNNVNFWKGATTLMPLIGGFIGDAYTGRFRMVLFSSLLYLQGLSMLTMSQFIPSLKPCNNEICDRPRKFHEVVFFLALYCIALGTGGFKPCLESFGADQFDDEHLEERKKKMSFFNWWTFVLSLAMLLGATVVVYVQDFVSWGVACLILTTFMALTFIAFYVGMPFYRFRDAEGNPFMPILQVLVAAIRKRNLSSPSNPALLYEVPKSDKGRLLNHTSRLRFLDKAAIVEEKYTGQKVSSWRLTTVTRVEETKLILNVVPMWLTSLLVGVSVAQGGTLFVKQAASMNLKISDNFKIPPASMSSLAAFGSIISVPIYDKIIVPVMRKATGNERGISILMRIGIGLALSIIIMVVTASVETKRYRLGETMSVLWLIPQYLILGLQYTFSLVGLQEYFYDQVPDSMRSLGMALYLSVLGVGYFLNSFLIMIVDHVTGKNGKSWIGKDINSSRLDKFYWMLTMVNTLNLCLFLLFAKMYTYKTVQRKARENEIDDGVVTMA
ncbi:uncharacterized protein LOC109792206 [Cajanus cajan]|uniref:uncharacterized protein LOC109792206 n=1 Tax=Cajanus cajan TaxID=3821 RepID=UPI0010FB8777|nr:uncharacterized protein LOC109792206 [Cajanus cajan]